MQRKRSGLMAIGLGAALLACPMMKQAEAALPQMGGEGQGKALPSPPADASVTLSGHAVTVHYNAPSIRGRKIVGGLVPYDKVWRTGANPATLFKTSVALKVGSASVPAGTYTLYSLPAAGAWKLIINKQTGQWGTQYDEKQDLARVAMKQATLPGTQEKMSISFENTHGASTELHVKWETTDVSVPVTAE